MDGNEVIFLSQPAELIKDFLPVLWTAKQQQLLHKFLMQNQRKLQKDFGVFGRWQIV